MSKKKESTITPPNNRVIKGVIDTEGVDIATARDILWPCKAFTVTLETEGSMDVNVFEMVVLKLAELGTVSTNKVADTLCMEEELVGFIQRKLNSIGRLSDDYTMSEIGVAILKDSSNRKEAPTESVSATVLFDLCNGVLLPYIEREQLQYYEVINTSADKKGDTYVELKKDPKNKITTKATVVSYDDAHDLHVPTPRDVIKCMNNLAAWEERYSGLRKYTGSGASSMIQDAEAITVNEVSEDVYLHTKVIIQKGSDEVLVARGHAPGFSQSFAEYLDSNASTGNEGWLSELRSSAVTQKDNSQGDDSSENTTRDVLRKHPRINKALRRAARHVKEIKESKVSADHDEKKVQDMVGKAAVDLYQAVEAALHFVAHNNSIDYEKYLVPSVKANGELLSEIAKGLGLRFSDRVGKAFLKVTSNKANWVSRHKEAVELQPLLAMALLSTKEIPDTPLVRLADGCPDAFETFFTLKKARDRANHKGFGETGVSVEDIGEYCRAVEEIVEILIPDVSFEWDDAPDTHHKEEQGMAEYSRARTNARAALERDKRFGYSFISEDPLSVREELIRVRMLGEEQTLSVKQKEQYVVSLASILQAAFSNANKKHPPLGKDSKALKSEALHKLIEAGFYSTINDIPREIETVKENRLFHEARGRNGTLGSAFLVAILLMPKEDLKLMASKNLHLVQTVAEIIQLRGHGHSSGSHLSEEDLKGLANKVYTIISMIRES